MATTQQPTAPTITQWRVDPSHSHVEFAVKHMMISTVKGRFSDIDGTVAADGTDWTHASIEVSIKAASIDTRDEKRDAHLRSADFFDAETYPSITFRSTRIVAAGTDQYRVAGDLTIHGVTKPVTLDVTAEGQGKDPWGGERVGFSASTRIDRQDFGLSWNQALDLGGVLVGNDIRISLDIELLRQD
jgi:polyisoprenoid-binding protein YceI